MKYILILKHFGKRKSFYTVHLMDESEYLRIYGKFSSLKKAKERAKKEAESRGIEIKYGIAVKKAGELIEVK